MLPVNGMDTAIYFLAMGGEAAKGQDNADEMEIWCEEDNDENRMSSFGYHLYIFVYKSSIVQ